MSAFDPSVAPPWPRVPACYGWLSLDRRGRWNLKGQVVSHAGLVSFINSNYGSDTAGNWIFQNGPQAVFVSLDYTPFIFRLEAQGRLTAHTGSAAELITAVYFDDEGSALLHTNLGIGVLDNRDLCAFLSECLNELGFPAGEDELLRTMTGSSSVFWHGLPVQAIKCHDVARQFGFEPRPAPRG